VKRHVGIAIALLLGGVTSLVVLWGIYQMLLLLVLVAVPHGPRGHHRRRLSRRGRGMSRSQHS
jgi:hypothetical protein